jgi:hypothetical protein
MVDFYSAAWASTPWRDWEVWHGKIPVHRDEASAVASTAEKLLIYWLPHEEKEGVAFDSLEYK